MKLVCLPYAGGSFSAFLKWKPRLCDQLELVPVELSGRGMRLKEPFYPDMQSAVDDIFTQIVSEISRQPYILFGHSMGSILVYELLAKIRSEHIRGPEHIVFSGSLPPDCFRVHEDIHDKPFSVIKQRLSELGGTSAVLFEDPDLCSVFLPILRADYRLMEQYRFVFRPVEAACSIFYGTDDIVTKHENFARWQSFSQHRMRFFAFRGGHFFINDLCGEVVEQINLLAEEFQTICRTV